MVDTKAPVKTKASPPKAKTAPAKKAPVKKAPSKAKTAPAKKTAPVKKTPVKTAPAKTAPVKTAPAKTAPAKTAPAKTAPAKSEAPALLKGKKIEKSVTPVSEPVKVATPAPEILNDTPYDTEFSGLLKDLDSALSLMKDLRGRVAKLEKQVHRDTKATNKKLKGRKKRVIDPNAEPSGFAKPGPVSAELGKFLGLKKDELISRTAVTKRINAYCRENKLQLESDKRKIIPDAPLKKLLKMKTGDELTFFNLQTYMKKHFPNKEGKFPVA
jgi:chromatin remodeling complex protein RSC6